MDRNLDSGAIAEVFLGCLFFLVSAVRAVAPAARWAEHRASLAIARVPRPRLFKVAWRLSAALRAVHVQAVSITCHNSSTPKKKKSCEGDLENQDNIEDNRSKKKQSAAPSITAKRVDYISEECAFLFL